MMLILDNPSAHLRLSECLKRQRSGGLAGELGCVEVGVGAAAGQ